MLLLQEHVQVQWGGCLVPILIVLLGGVDKLIPVDVYLSGCPPKPKAIIDVITKLRKKISREIYENQMSLIIVKFEHQVWNLCSHIPTIGICEITSAVREMSFAHSSLFLTYTRIYLSKTMISNLLTIRSSLNFNTRFRTHFTHPNSWDLRNIVCDEVNVPCTDTLKWRLHSLLLLSDTWKPQQRNQKKCLRNLRETLKTLLSLPNYTCMPAQR